MVFGDRFDIRAALDDEVREEYFARAAERERAAEDERIAERERAAADRARATGRTYPVYNDAPVPVDQPPATPVRGAQAASNPARRGKPSARGQVAGGLWSASYAAADGDSIDPAAGEYVEVSSEAVWDNPGVLGGPGVPHGARTGKDAGVTTGLAGLRDALQSLKQGNARVYAAILVLALVAVALLVVLAVSTCAGPAAEPEAPAPNDTTVEQPEAPALIPLSQRDTSGFGLGDDGKLVVALDPGHGADDPGVILDDVYEANVDWTIAQYCADYLRQYEGVEVVFTRGESTNPSFEERSLAAVTSNADILVSLHINWNDDPAEQGVYTYYPNTVSTWKYDETVVPGTAVATSVLGSLVTLGLKNNGAWEYTASIYDDPEVAPLLYQDDETGVTDYYAIIRWPRAYGIPAVLVEHAFLSSPTDGPLLKVDSFLKAVGEADAKGILEVYGFPVE